MDDKKTYIIKVGGALNQIIEAQASVNPVLSTAEWITSKLAELLMSGKVLKDPECEDEAYETGRKAGFELSFEHGYKKAKQMIRETTYYLGCPDADDYYQWLKKKQEDKEHVD